MTSNNFLSLALVGRLGGCVVVSFLVACARFNPYTHDADNAAIGRIANKSALVLPLQIAAAQAMFVENESVGSEGSSAVPSAASVSISGPVDSTADIPAEWLTPASLKIVYSANYQGQLLPCGCAQNPEGGLSRRAEFKRRFVRALGQQKTPSPLLMIEGGNVLWSHIDPLMSADELSLKWQEQQFLADQLIPQIQISSLTRWDFFQDTQAAFNWLRHPQQKNILNSNVEALAAKPYVLVPLHQNKALVLFQFWGQNFKGIEPSLYQKTFETLKIKSPTDIYPQLWTEALSTWQQSHPEAQRADLTPLWLTDALYNEVREWLSKVEEAKMPKPSLVFLAGWQVPRNTSGVSGIEEWYPGVKVVIPKQLGKALWIIDIDSNEQQLKTNGTEVNLDARFAVDNKVYQRAIKLYDQIEAKTAANLEQTKKEMKWLGETTSIFETHPEKGVTTCKQCHLPQYEFWKKTPHALALLSLIPQNAFQRSECISCHSTEFQKQPGFNVGKQVWGENQSEKAFIRSQKLKEDLKLFLNKLQSRGVQGTVGSGSGKSDSTKLAALATFSLRQTWQRNRAEFEQIAEQYWQQIEHVKPAQNYAGVQCANCHHQPNQDVREEQSKFDTAINLPNKPHRNFEQVTTATCQKCHDGVRADAFQSTQWAQMACPHH